MMNLKIAFRGLQEGKHTLTYELGALFFQAIEDSEFSNGQINAVVDILKRNNGLEVTFRIKGKVSVACDRCLEEFDCPVSYKGKLYFEFGQESAEVSHELVMLGESDDYIDLGEYIYEFVSLSLPYQRIHPEDENGVPGCDPVMLEKLSEHLVDEEPTEDSDPRWDKLKDLLN